MNVKCEASAYTQKSLPFLIENNRQKQLFLHQKSRIYKTWLNSVRISS